MDISIKGFVKETYCSFVDSAVINGGFGCGYGYEVETPYAAFSARFSVNPINVQITNEDIKFYASIYAGATYSAEGLEAGPKIYIIVDYETREIHDLSECSVQMSDVEYGVSAYKGMGASISLGFKPLY